MSGIEIVGLISAIIDITKTTVETYQAIKNLHDLPEAFDEVNRRFPLVTQTLQKAEDESKNATPEEKKALEPLLESCRNKAKELLDIFKNIQESKDKSFRSAYRAIVTKMRKDARVETLMDNILKDLGVLAAHHAFQDTMQRQVEPLQIARDDLAKVTPSIPDEEINDNAGSAIQFGDKNRQYNSFGGTQKIFDGDSYEAGRDLNLNISMKPRRRRGSSDDD